MGSRALDMAGEVDMGSSSGDGDSEAFRFRDEDGVDTTRMPCQPERLFENIPWTVKCISEAGLGLYLR